MDSHYLPLISSNSSYHSQHRECSDFVFITTFVLFISNSLNAREFLKKKCFIDRIKTKWNVKKHSIKHFISIDFFTATM